MPSFNWFCIDTNRTHFSSFHLSRPGSGRGPGETPLAQEEGGAGPAAQPVEEGGGGPGQVQDDR